MLLVVLLRVAAVDHKWRPVVHGGEWQLESGVQSKFDLHLRLELERLCNNVDGAVVLGFLFRCMLLLRWLLWISLRLLLWLDVNWGWLSCRGSSVCHFHETRG